MLYDKRPGEVARTISIPQEESKQVVATLAHLRQVLVAAASLKAEIRIRRPVSVDHASLLTAAASMRALLFDDSPTPILIDLLRRNEIGMDVDTFETDLSMLFLSQFEPSSSGHVSDLFQKFLIDPDDCEGYEVDKPMECLIAESASEACERIARRHDLWSMSAEQVTRLNTGVGWSHLGGPSQLFHVTRRIVDLENWGSTRLGYLKDIPIRRKNIILYVANKLGGVHYDSRRLPSGKEDRQAFKVLSELYDLENVAVMHAGLVAVAVACIELLASGFLDLWPQLERFHRNRQRRLEGLSPEVKNGVPDDPQAHG